MTPPLRLAVQRQPDDTTCGPTCLHAVYEFFEDPLPLEAVIAEVEELDGGGTLGVRLANHALERGYQATLYTYNLELFDPTWFQSDDVDIQAKLIAQLAVKGGERRVSATRSYLEFLRRGGRLRMEDLTSRLLREHLEAGSPVLVGLSATYLYGCAREKGDRVMVYDDVEGAPSGHFVVLCGYDAASDRVHVADPLQDNPRYGSGSYDVSMERLLCAILLGVLTYDGNLLVLSRTGTAQ